MFIAIPQPITRTSHLLDPQGHSLLPLTAVHNCQIPADALPPSFHPTSLGLWDTSFSPLSLCLSSCLYPSNSADTERKMSWMHGTLLALLAVLLALSCESNAGDCVIWGHRILLLSFGLVYQEYVFRWLVLIVTCMFCPLTQCLKRQMLHPCLMAKAARRIHKVSTTSATSLPFFLQATTFLHTSLAHSTSCCLHCRSIEEDLHEGGQCFKLLQAAEQKGCEVSGWD